MAVGPLSKWPVLPGAAADAQDDGRQHQRGLEVRGAPLPVPPAS